MAFAYKKLIIKTNAIVPKGAMQKKAVYKEDDGSFLKLSNLVKDDAKLEVTACLAKFNEFDSQDMILDDETVRDEAMVNFLLKGNKQIKILHKTEDNKENYIDAFLKEIYVAKADNIVNAPEGSILTTYKFKNKEDWDVAKELDLEFSFEGSAELVPVKKDVKLTKENLINFIKGNQDVFVDFFGEKTISKVVKKEDIKGDEGNNEITEIKKQLADLLKEQKELQKSLSQRISSINVDKEDSNVIDINKIEL